MISTWISPSLNRPTMARPSGCIRCRAMSCASTGFALPVNTAIVDWSTRLSLVPSPSGAGDHLAGVEGFEPSYDGIKTRCLTTWRHPSFKPSRSRGIAPPPGVPAGANGRALGPRNRATPVAGPRGPLARTLDRRTPRRRSCRCPSSALRPAGEPGQCPAHLGTAPGHHRLAIVATTCLQEAANCRLGGFPCQFRSLKHLGGRDADPRKHDGEVPFGQFQGGQSLPDPFAPGAFPRGRRTARPPRARARVPRATTAASRKPQISLRATSVVAASELPPPRPPWTGMCFSSRMSTPNGQAAGRLQPPGGAHGTGPSSGATSAGPARRRISPSVARREVQPVGEVDELKHRSGSRGSRRHGGRSRAGTG